MTLLVVSVVSGNDDAHEAADGTGFDRTATELQAYANASAGSQFHAGMRFTGITIPVGSTITAATIDIEITTSDDARVGIGCEDVDDAADFLTNPDVTSRAQTSLASWVQNNIGLGVATSPDIASAVQVVIDRPGWESGNALVVMLRAFASGNKKLDFAAFEHATGAPVELTIEYTIPPEGDAPLGIPAVHGAIVQRTPDSMVLS